MSHVLNYRDHYFRVDVAEIVSFDSPGKSVYVGWCSEGFRDLKDFPQHRCSRQIGGSPLSTQAEALRHAYDWIRGNWDARQAESTPSLSGKASVFYTVWLFKGGDPTGFEFVDYKEAKAFAEAAQKSSGATKIGIKDNESPQFLTLWEKS